MKHKDCPRELIKCIERKINIYEESSESLLAMHTACQ